MAGTKRSSPDSSDHARAPKIAKTESSSKKGTKKSIKPAIPAATFKYTAMPLHVNFTHTPPTIADAETEAKSTATADPGFIGNLTLIPSSFSTGSYGWKGSKRMTLDLQNSDDGDTKEKVQVMLTINATVIGSKQAKPGDEPKEKEPEDLIGDELVETDEKTD